ncbi:NAT10 [Bugula neritina]|uniref:NAT10 n=1 Tax=Bugula neritina TaxID=10212 RepID=A0A7J7KH86_BUGNE|nr:NAT10 [Bugula neritina]
MKEPIRYAEGDLVEAWLNRLLCLDTTEVEKISCGNPLPERCNLYYVNRDTLFSSNKTSEEFLLKIMNVYTSSDYKEIKKNKSENNDSISWTIAQKFQDDEFAERSEARIVRIATHPDYQRAVNQMEQKYRSQGRTRLPPLLTKLSERRPASIDYFSISYDLTSELLKFWQSCGFLPVYLGQTQNALTGENSCIMLKILNEEEKRDDESSWLKAFHQELTIEELNHFFTLHDMKRLKKYSSKLVDFSLIMDLIPDIAKLYFSGKMPDVLLSDVQQNLLVSVGLQRKPVGNLEAEVNKPSTQVMALLNKVAVKCYQSLTAVIEEAMREELSQQGKTTPNLKYQKLEQELSNAVAAHEKSQKAAKKQFKSQMLTEDILAQYKIKGREEDWNMALSATGRVPNIISVKRTEDNSKKRKITIPDTDPAAVSKKKKKKPKVPKN